MNRIGVFFLAGVVLLGVLLFVFADFRTSLPSGRQPSIGAPPEQSEAAALPVEAAGILSIPVAGVSRAALVDTWGQSRAGGLRTHKAIDILAPRGTPVIAAASGRVEKLFNSLAGGRTLYVRGADEGTVYYYAHLDAYRAGLRAGQRVRQGDVLATVGSTGNARADAPHLHFEIKRMRPGERWWQGREVNPYPLLARPTAGR